MPYTPPSQRSPASSNPNSPVISRTQSYNASDLSASVAASSSPGTHLGSSSSSSRPALPRSLSSTSYLNKHRRTPSLPQNIPAAVQEHARTSLSVPPRGSPQNGSVRQSPPPVNNLTIPSGAITTPPDSAQGSDDDDERGRQWGNLAELQEALSSIEVRRDASPRRDADSPAAAPLLCTPQRSLTPEARKISHSRSSSDVHLSKHSSAIAESPDNTSDSELDDDELRIKPPLLRKKSGELVKPALRPSSRRRPSSMPGTPTFSKAVHFNDNIEQVRHFLQVDKPSAVSAGSSPVETAYDSESEYPFEGHSSSKKLEWEIRLANFPRETFERKTLPVRVERIFLSADTKTLIGTVAVANIAFHKSVTARFTLDYWKTTSEVVAEYNNDVRKKQVNDGYDRFNFNIKLVDQANLESKTLLLCVRYNVDGQEHWDNNSNMNYQVDFIKKIRQKALAKSAGGSPGGSMGAIPRSRHSPPSARPRSFPSRSSFEDDFGHGFDPKFQFGAPKPFIGDSPNNSIKLKPKSKRPSIFPDPSSSSSSSSGRPSRGGGQAFSTRYDFGASLSAALTNAQNALGERSGIMPKLPHLESTAQDVSAVKANDNLSVPVAASASSSNTAEKPGLQSAEYNELIQKFCFFGSGSSSGKDSPLPTSTPQEQTDGNDSDHSEASGQTSGSNSPATPISDLSRLFDGADDRPCKSPTHFLSRSSSPGPFTGSDIGDPTQSHMNFGYPYNHSNVHGSILGDSHTPQPILG
ncbi:hypothetical protein EJ05DRAFT_432889 [Pseudovirgaria hyperparasitica]|uniref:CBM21 domain-containing protein n=1 Tax=Pseudovirgaria hyperparasitica TaxID=470096 RepID=A0A6A6WMV1_9PEZI|nr:uncharacterized protein EJ05DRAFT_432889 [Pseudovirgaria hyperparasitica]KAF2763551.1 hypothetical protein EJ05DRAFT_432889 [Pseudovirgaria hyperparasitica]